MTKKRYTWFLARVNKTEGLDIMFSAQKKENLVEQAKYTPHTGQPLVLIRSQTFDGITLVPSYYRQRDDERCLLMEIMRPMVGNVGYELMGAE